MQENLRIDCNIDHMTAVSQCQHTFVMIDHINVFDLHPIYPHQPPVAYFTTHDSRQMASCPLFRQMAPKSKKRFPTVLRSKMDFMLRPLLHCVLAWFLFEVGSIRQIAVVGIFGKIWPCIIKKKWFKSLVCPKAIKPTNCSTSAYQAVAYLDSHISWWCNSFHTQSCTLKMSSWWYSGAGSLVLSKYQNILSPRPGVEGDYSERIQK